MRRGSLVFMVFVLAMSVLSVAPVSAVTEPGSEQAEFAFEEAEAELVIENRFKEGGNGTWIVILDDAPLATYDGSTDGLSATGPETTGDAKVDVDSPEARAYLSYLEGQHDAFLNDLGDTLGRSFSLKHQYFNALNGVALYLEWEEAARVARMSGVATVLKDTKRELATDAGPGWIGAPGIWDGSAVPGIGTLGEGVIVGILDSGINPSNPSFADIGGDGYDHTNPFGAGNYVGICDPGSDQHDASFLCNDKLIGAWNFTGDGTIFDDDGHGSHTASTTAGNVVLGATVEGPTITEIVDISGVAPHANIISYDVCPGESCTGSAIIAGINQAIADGVDVINYSIGSAAPGNPWVEADELAFLDARAAGIFVAHSAGNEGPGAATVGSPMAPWMTHVAAMTHNRSYPNALVAMTGGATTPPADISGLGFTSAFGPARIIYAGALPADIKQSAVDRGVYESIGDVPDNALCGLGDLGAFDSPWEPETFQGEIVVCDRGTFGRVEKGANVKAAGAGGYVLADNGGGLSGDPHELPGVHITQADGETLKAWLADGGTDHTASIAGATRLIDDANANVLAGFSSRGPNRSAEFIAPSLAAPGVDIIAAAGQDDSVVWDFLSGTSMSSPHVAGAAALLTALHPDWTPAEIESAMMMTSIRDVLIEDGVTPATPFDTGSGRLDLVAAANAALVLKETKENYEAADPALGGDTTALNMASMAESECVLECSWTRTFTSVADGPVTWNVAASAEGGVVMSVNPSSFTINPGDTQDVTVTADVEGAPSDTWLFGEVTLTPTSDVPAAHLPLAVQPTTGSIPEIVNITTSRTAGSWIVDGLEAIEIEDLAVDVSGLTKGTKRDSFLPVDPTNGDAFDDLSQVFVYTFEADDDTIEVIAEITASESPDLDLFLGYDVNGDGVPNPDSELACVSASASAFETCSFDGIPGTWWVVVQNWEASAPDAEDWFTLATAAVNGSDLGNMSVDGPATVPQLEPFSVSVLFDLPDAEPGDRYYGAFSLGTSPSRAGNIGTVPVRLDRVDDDVVKAADVTEARPGDTITYEVTISPNVFNQDLVYTVTDELPDGVTYVDGSATNGATFDGSAVTWTGVVESPLLAEQFYDITTSATNPSCATPFGTLYADLEALAGFTTAPDISGDTSAWTFGTAVPFHFYGSYYNSFTLTDDGFMVFDASQWGGAATPWVPQSIPDAALPNGLLGALWSDFEVVYDAPSNSGVTVASAAGGALQIIEFDDLRPYLGGAPDPGGLLDIGITMWSDPGPGPEIVVSFDNVAALPPIATIGAESPSGTSATSIVNAGDPSSLLGGVVGGGQFAICYDWVSPTFDPITFIYQVTVDEDATDGPLTNTVVSETDMAGDVAASTAAAGDIDNLGFIEGEPYAVLDQISDEIGELLADVADDDPRRDVRSLARAQSDLNRSMRDRYWLDEDSLSSRGWSAFWYMQRAANRLESISDDASFDDEAEALARSIAVAARTLATTQIDDSNAHPWLLARAEKWVDRGDDDLDDGRHGSAISSYRYAWWLSRTRTWGWGSWR